MKNKKTSILLCFVFLLICLTGCGNQDDASQQAEMPTATPASAEEIEMPPLLESSETDLEQANRVLTDWGEKQKEIWDIVLGDISMDTEKLEEFETEDGTHETGFLVTDPRYSAMADLEKTINGLCTQSGVIALEINGWEELYVEHNGQLYRRMSDLVVVLPYECMPEIVGIVEQADDRLVIRVPASPDSEVSVDFVDLSFIKQKDTWLFDGMSAYRVDQNGSWLFDPSTYAM